MLGNLFGAWAGSKVAEHYGRRGSEGRGALLGAALASRRFRKLGLAGLALSGGLQLYKHYKAGKAKRPTGY